MSVRFRARAVAFAFIAAAFALALVFSQGPLAGVDYFAVVVDG